MRSRRAGYQQRISLAQLYGIGVRPHVLGRSVIVDDQEGVKLELLESNMRDGYGNAQLDDYRLDKRNNFRWKANVRLQLRARFSHPADQMTGTAGFGFWNAPIGVGVRRTPSPPAAAWFFFAGPNSEIPLARDVPANGWKAASLDARTLWFYLLLPTVPLAIPLMRMPPFHNLLWPVAQRVMRVDERMLNAPLNQWHDYTIVWTRDAVRYQIDGSEIHVCRRPPTGRMGFVAWIDNQFMVATPQGHFRQGTVPVAVGRTLEISNLSLCPL